MQKIYPITIWSSNFKYFSCTLKKTRNTRILKIYCLFFWNLPYSFKFWRIHLTRVDQYAKENLISKADFEYGIPWATLTHSASLERSRPHLLTQSLFKSLAALLRYFLSAQSTFISIGLTVSAWMQPRGSIFHYRFLGGVQLEKIG